DMLVEVEFHGHGSFLLRWRRGLGAPVRDGLRLGRSDLPETHVSGGTEWVRAKPDPRAWPGLSRGREAGVVRPAARHARGHGPAGRRRAQRGACPLTGPGRS